MKMILRILTGLVVLIAIFMGVGMLLPREVTVERSIEIHAPAEDIYKQVANLEATKAWSPWLELDPETELKFNDVAEGVGAVMEWKSENQQVGAGRMEVVEATPGQDLTVDLDFGDMGTAVARWDFVEADGVTVATWGMVADMGSGPVGRWIGLKMDDWVGADYERGLQNLKTLVEGN